VLESEVRGPMARKLLKETEDTCELAMSRLAFPSFMNGWKWGC